MADAVGAAARGAMEAGKRDGGQPQADSAGAQGVEGDRCSGRGRGQVLRAWYGTIRLFTRGRRWERGPPYSPESCGAGIGRGSAVGRRA